MNSVDAATIRNIRRELGKRPLESTRIDVQVVNGHVTLAGVATRLRDKPDVDLTNEMATIQKLVMRDRTVKEVSINVRLVEEIKEKESHDSRGRMR